MSRWRIVAQVLTFFITAFWVSVPAVSADEVELDDEPYLSEEEHRFSDGWFSFAAPERYELADGKGFEHLSGLVLIKPGGRQALKQALPGHELTRSMRRRWLEKDQKAILTVSSQLLSTLEEVKTTDNQAKQTERCKRIFGRLDKKTFAVFDERTGIGRCVNHGGTFMAVHTREVGRYLVMVEAIDFVEFLVWKDTAPLNFEELSEFSKWWQLRRAANAFDAENVLLSTKRAPSWTSSDNFD